MPVPSTKLWFTQCFCPWYLSTFYINVNVCIRLIYIIIYINIIFINIYKYTMYPHEEYTTSQAQPPNPHGPYGGFFLPRNGQSDSQVWCSGRRPREGRGGGRKAGPRSKASRRKRGVQKMSSWLPWTIWIDTMLGVGVVVPILFCHPLSALRPYDVLGQRHRGYVRRFAERLGPLDTGKSCCGAQFSSDMN